MDIQGQDKLKARLKEQSEKYSAMLYDLGVSETRGFVEALFDEGSFIEFGRFSREEASREGTSVVTGHGLIKGCPAYIYAQDSAVSGGAIGAEQAKKITKLYDLAAQNGQPVIAVFDSEGVKLSEGIDVMDGVSSIVKKSGNVSGVIPQISVILGSCVGSVAMVANNGDVTVKVKSADYYLNPGDESAAADINVEDREEAFDAVKKLIALLPSNNLASAQSVDADKKAEGSFEAAFASDEILAALADGGSSVVIGEGENLTALARIGGTASGVVVISQEKVSGCQASKIARFVRFCDCFSLPIVTFVDSAGFSCLKGASKVSHAYAEAVSEKITVISGKAYGAAYIAVASEVTGADVVYGWPVATVLPFSPEAGIHIFWKDRLEGMKNPVEDRKKLAEEFAVTQGDILKVAGGGYITDIILPVETRDKVINALELLKSKRGSRLPKKHSNIRI